MEKRKKAGEGGYCLIEKRGEPGGGGGHVLMGRLFGVDARVLGNVTVTVPA